MGLIPDAQRSNLDTVLSTQRLSYRDAVLIQLAYALCTPGLDTTRRHTGVRSVAANLPGLLASAHIPSVRDAFQNIGKNFRELVRGNFSAFDAFLTWARGATTDQFAACFEYACAVVTAGARPVLAMPELAVSRLTFAAVMGLYEQLFAAPSQGAHEQYIVASLLDALVRQSVLPGYRVETRRLNASDRSSRAAGDVQIMVGSRTIEAYEVTTMDWRTKLIGVGDKLREHDLTRVHVVAPLATRDYTGITRDLLALTEDISVIELRGFTATIVSTLTRTYRALALQRLHELLERYQDDATRVNAYVALLDRNRLTAGPIEQGG